ncbi:MAG: alanine--tRNA ligase-related protein, partial [Metallosphaera sp.]
SFAQRKDVGVEDLIRLYDSHGIPPDLIADELRSKGLKVEIPHNFYSIVAKRHQSAPVKKEWETTKLPLEVVNQVKDLEPTEKVYYQDQYARKFEGKVIKSIGKYLVLNRTVFYPEGGGQLGDQGWITIGNERIKVVDTQKVNEVVVHVMEREVDLNGNETVQGEIDWVRRFRMMRHHTATHVILAAAKKLLGDHVWQAGAEKTPEKARLDITHHKNLSEEDIIKLEHMANQVIDDRRPVTPFEINRTEAELKFGVSIYEGGVPNKPTLRLLDIKDWDVESCGGTHVSNTADIGGVKIINVEKIQDGIIRLEYVAGDVVSLYARQLEDKISSLASKLETSPSQLEFRLNKLIEENEEMKELVASYRRQFLEGVERVVELRRINEITLALLPTMVDTELEKEAIRRLTSKEKVVAIHVSQTNGKLKVDIGTSRDLNVSFIVNNLVKAGAKGGGKGTFASLMMEGKKEEIIDIVERAIKSGYS